MRLPLTHSSADKHIITCQVQGHNQIEIPDTQILIIPNNSFLSKIIQMN